MKKIIALLLAAVFALSLTSCTVSKTDGKGADNKDDTAKTAAADSAQADNKDDKNGSASDTGKPTAAVNYSKVIKKLNNKEKKLVDSLGESEKGKKLVAYFGDGFETQFIVADFKDGKVSKVKNYRFFEKDGAFNAFKSVSQGRKGAFVIHEDEKCVEITETKKYYGKTYDEMVELLGRYDFK